MRDFSTVPGVKGLLGLLRKGLDDPTRAPILWVGAGMSIPAGYPSWSGLADRLREKTVHDLPADLDPLQTIDAFVEKNGRGLFKEVLSDVFEQHHKPLEYHHDLMRLPWKIVVTTNYDELLEDALKSIDKGYRTRILDQNLDVSPGPDLPLYKVHGSIDNFEEIVLDSKAYETFGANYPLLVADFESMLRRHHLVFFGCGMTDPRLVEWLEKLGPEGRDNILPAFTVIVKGDRNSIPQEIRQLLKEAGIAPILLDGYNEIPELISYLRQEVCPLPAGPHLTFQVSRTKASRDRWSIVSPSGKRRTVDAPWKKDHMFVFDHREFGKLTGRAVSDEKESQELHRVARKLGQALADAVFSKNDLEELKSRLTGGSPPLLTIESDENLILSLPWELLVIDGEFVVREARVDLARCVAGGDAVLPPPDRCISLVVNVSAPQGSHLDYEAESYRITKALHDYVEIHYTDLGTVKDLLDALEEHKTMGVHFSGHGGPGTLVFEDDEGMKHEVKVGDLLAEFRSGAAGSFPRFFYLASCHGNTPVDINEDEPGSFSSAAQLHREGIAEVVGYFNPIQDELSTCAEVTLYRAIAEGLPTRIAVRQARRELCGKSVVTHDDHKRELCEPGLAEGLYPYAWAQLVFYHRGEDNALSKKLPGDFSRRQEERLERTFHDTRMRRILATGFIGRRRELHEFRRRHREGKRVFVFQGLGGIGKTALAEQRVLQLIRQDKPILPIWCRELREEENLAAALVRELSDFGQRVFGHKWMEVVFEVDRIPDATESQRFEAFLGVLVGNWPDLTIYIDNMETLLAGPENKDTDAFGKWKSEELEEIWRILEGKTRDGLFLLASCRYRNESFLEGLIPLSPMGDSALFRMMGWFPTLRRLSTTTRAKLVEKLAGHPRAVELLEGRLADAMRKWEDRKGRWTTPATEEGIEKEWKELVGPALPEVEKELTDDLLLDSIWQNVLDDRARRMLFRMTLLRRPWDWNLMMQLGDEDQPVDSIEQTVGTLRRCSLVMEAEERAIKGDWMNVYSVHPATAQFARARMAGQAPELEQRCYLVVGTYLEKLAKTSRDIRVHIDAGEYLFLAGQCEKACDLLALTSQTLQQFGRVRDGLALLERFATQGALGGLSGPRPSQVLGTLGNGYLRLGQAKKAIGYYEKALAICQEIGDGQGEGACQGSLGLAYADLGQPDTAIKHYRNSLAIHREIGDREGEAKDLGNLGNAYYRVGHVEKAIEYFENALGIEREIGDTWGEGACLGSLGSAYYRLGQVQKAVEYYEKALAIQRDIGDREGEGNQLGNLGLAYARLGQVEKAIEYHEKALAIAREIGDRRGEGSDLGNLGIAYAALGQVEEAIEYHEKALAIARESGERHGEGSILGNLGIAYAALGQVDKAIEYTRQALAIGEEIKDPQIVSVASAKLEELGGKKGKSGKPRKKKG